MSAPRLTDEQLAELEALAEGASEGPWQVSRSSRYTVIAVACDSMEVVHDAWSQDAAFIAAARDAVPALLARVRALEAALRTCANMATLRPGDLASAVIAEARHAGVVLPEVPRG